MAEDTDPQPSLNGEDLDRLERDTFRYFADQINLENGLITDNTRVDSPSSIAVVGFALTAYAIAVERKYLTRSEALKRALASLRFFNDGPQGPDPEAIGYHGFYYHFLDMKSGRRFGNSEISTIDSAYLIAGALTAAEYFNRDTKDERELRKLADTLYHRADWHWAQNRALTVSHGWKPKTKFILYRWTGFNEA